MLLVIRSSHGASWTYCSARACVSSIAWRYTLRFTSRAGLRPDRIHRQSWCFWVPPNDVLIQREIESSYRSRVASTYWSIRQANSFHSLLRKIEVRTRDNDVWSGCRLEANASRRSRSRRSRRRFFTVWTALRTDVSLLFTAKVNKTSSISPYRAKCYGSYPVSLIHSQHQQGNLDVSEEHQQDPNDHSGLTTVYTHLIPYHISRWSEKEWP